MRLAKLTGITGLTSLPGLARLPVLARLAGPAGLSVASARWVLASAARCRGLRVWSWLLRILRKSASLVLAPPNLRI